MNTVSTRTLSSRPPVDYIGMWYRARAGLGIDDRIEFIFIDPCSGERDTVALRHRDHDGVGGIAQALKPVSYPHLTLPTIPPVSIPLLAVSSNSTQP